MPCALVPRRSSYWRMYEHEVSEWSVAAHLSLKRVSNSLIEPSANPAESCQQQSSQGNEESKKKGDQ
jgi:hypothetical protein